MAHITRLHRRTRRLPRIPLHQPVALVHSNGTVATACALHVTPGDMQVRCDRYTLDSLYPGGFARYPDMDRHRTGQRY